MNNNQIFINALRDMLGRSPLYGKDTPTPQFIEFELGGIDADYVTECSFEPRSIDQRTAVSVLHARQRAKLRENA